MMQLRVSLMRGVTEIGWPAVQGVSHLDTEMGTLRNLLTNSAVLLNALKEVAQPSIKPTESQPKLDGSAPGARIDVDWAQTTDGLRCASFAPMQVSLCLPKISVTSGDEAQPVVHGIKRLNAVKVV